MIKENNKCVRNSIVRIIKPLKFILICSFLAAINSTIYAQQNSSLTHIDSLALENIIVEKYYVSELIDFTDSTAGILSAGSVTYRIFVDMKPGYSLQVVYGNQKHELFFKTTTTFFNNLECRAETGFNIDAKRLNESTIALDSWITMGAASRLHTGILRSEDNDGSSFIKNRNSFIKADGLTKGTLPNFQIFNLDLNFFNNDSTASYFSVSDGAWAALGGVKGPTEENRVLIAQLTTSGKLTFGVNVQIGTPEGGVIQFVAKNPEGSEIQCSGLSNE
jgi:hypothetical protein